MFFPGHVGPFDTNIPDILVFQVELSVIVSFSIFAAAGMSKEHRRRLQSVEC